MAWSSYAHLPNGEKEYVEILSQIENGMSRQKSTGVQRRILRIKKRVMVRERNKKRVMVRERNKKRLMV